MWEREGGFVKGVFDSVQYKCGVSEVIKYMW